MVRTTGAARFYAESILGGPTRTLSTNFVVSTSPVVVAKGNPDRIALLIQNIGSTDAFTNFTADLLLALGIKLTQLGGAVIFIVKDDFTLVCETWSVITQTASTSIQVVEVISDVISVPEQH